MIPGRTKFLIQVKTYFCAFGGQSLTPFDHFLVKLDSTPTSIEFSPNSERIAIGTIRGKVIVYDMVGKKMTIQRQAQGSKDHPSLYHCPRIIIRRLESPIRTTLTQFHVLLLIMLKEYWQLHHGTSPSGTSVFHELDRTMSRSYDRRKYVCICRPIYPSPVNKAPD